MKMVFAFYILLKGPFITLQAVHSLFHTFQSLQDSWCIEWQATDTFCFSRCSQCLQAGLHPAFSYVPSIHLLYPVQRLLLPKAVVYMPLVWMAEFPSDWMLQHCTLLPWNRGRTRSSKRTHLHMINKSLQLMHKLLKSVNIFDLHSGPGHCSQK